MNTLMRLTSIVLLLTIYSLVSSCTSEAKLTSFSDLIENLATKDTDYTHRAASKQTWIKCDKRHTEIAGDFNYKEYFCYTYCTKKNRVSGKCVQMGLDKYHVINDHDLMVNRGVWIVR